MKKLQIENTITYLLAKTTANMKNHFVKILKEKNIDITLDQFLILLNIKEENGLYQKQIADKVMKDTPTITRMIDILEKRNLLFRESDKNDRRKYKIFITNNGNNIVSRMSPLLIENTKYYENIISREEENFLKKILNRINSKLEKSCVFDEMEIND